MNSEIEKPSFFLHLTEPFRVVFEIVKGWLFLKKYTFKNIGKNQRIIVVPGLLSTDFATNLLRQFLQKTGFNVSGWEMGMNLGRLDKLNALIKKVDEEYQSNQEKIILIGWSMGGIFAREVAKTIPHAVKRVITIGSPFTNVNAPSYAKWVFEVLNKGVKIDEVFMKQLPNPAGVRTLALYSKADGIVSWRACMELIEDENHENKEVFSGHFGMGANPGIMQAIEAELSS